MFDKFVKSKTYENVAIVHKMNEVIKQPEKISDKETKTSLPKTEFNVGDRAFFVTGLEFAVALPFSVALGTITKVKNTPYEYGYEITEDETQEIFTRPVVFATYEDGEKCILDWCSNNTLSIQSRIEELQAKLRKIDHKLYLFLQSIKESQNATGSEVSQES